MATIRKDTRWRWYASRVRAMSAREAAFRARRVAETLTEDALWRAVPSTWERAWEPPLARLVAAGRSPDASRGLLTAAQADPEESARLVTAAELALGRRVRLFGYPEVELDTDLPVRDPFTGGTWPDRHGKRLDYRTGGEGDPKWVWEVNRLQQLPLLCLAASVAERPDFAAAAAERAVAWVRASRPPYGVAWSNGFEAGLRGISLALTFDALRDSPHLDDVATGLLLRSLWQHARWIRRDPSRGSSANNHLLGEATGLVAIGLLAPELRDAASWVDEGLAVLAREADAQILPDGSSAEQAFAYHLFACDLLLLSTALVRACREDDGSPAVLAALGRAGDAITAQVAPGEPDPAYGDSDDGRAFLFDGDESRTAPAVAASIAAAVGHRACAELAGRPDLPARVLFGAEGAARSAHPTGSPAARSSVLRDSGLVVLRRGTVRVLFDAGPLGYLGIAAHGHADALSVTVSDGAQELITDPGTGTYFGDSERRHAFRGTRSHSTATVGDSDQALYAGPFLWLDHPVDRLTHVDLDAGAAVGELTTTAWRHHRAIVVLEGGRVVVYDRIDGDAREDRLVSWPLHPALVASKRGDRLVEARADGRTRLLVAVAGRQGAAQPEVTLRAAEWSRRLERVESATVVCATVAAASRTEVVTLLVPAHGDELGDLQLELADDSAAPVVAFQLDGPQRVRFDAP